MINKMAWVLKNGEIKVHLLVTIINLERKGLVFTNGQMEISIKECGLIMLLMAKLVFTNGKTESSIVGLGETT